MEPLSRLTPATADVLAVLLADAAPVWGLRVVARTGRPAGSVYPILGRLERAGWVESAWEDAPERPGPRRRLYSLTAEGAGAARAAVDRAAEGRAAARPARPAGAPAARGAQA